MINNKYRTLSEGLLDQENINVMQTFILDDKNEKTVSSSELLFKAKKILHYLQCNGVEAGDQVLLQLKDNCELLYVFWACILGRIIPIPFTYLENDRERPKLIKVWKSLSNPYLVTESYNLNRLNQMKEIEKEFDSCWSKDRVFTIESMDKMDGNATINMAEENDIAFIQFSSGSTSDPKGVIITHKNVIMNIKESVIAMQITEEDIFLNWLPLTHSFGLVCLYLVPFLSRLKCYIMPTKLFIKTPLLWLKKLSIHNITVSASPNFGLRHVCHYLKAYTNGKPKLDLSSMRIILNGAEPVSADVCRLFYDCTAEYGIKSTVIRPSYGMSEATLMISTPKPPHILREIIVDRRHLKTGQELIECSVNDPNAISFVELGECITGHELKIVADNGVSVKDLTIGHILLRGSMIFTGYYNNPVATQNAFDDDGWFWTGDLGFIRNGNLVITGRAKDVIFLKGENYYSYDIENICMQAIDERCSRVAVSGVCDNQIKQDEIICFVEYIGEISDFSDIATFIRRLVLSKMGLAISGVIPVKEIPTTASGKMQRFLLVEQFYNGYFKQIF